MDAYPSPAFLNLCPRHTCTSKYVLDVGTNVPTTIKYPFFVSFFDTSGLRYTSGTCAQDPTTNLGIHDVKSVVAYIIMVGTCLLGTS